MTAALALVAALLFSANPAAADPIPSAAALLHSTTFGVGTRIYWVPPAVTRLLVDATGAAGGAIGDSLDGGLGSRVVAVLTVTPGEALTVVVGGRGTGRAGGYNGGASGGQGGDFSGLRDGSGGGGATDVRRSDGLSGRVLVAGGGGGHGGALGGGSGGAGGGTPGAPGRGTSTVVPDSVATGGGAGTLAGGGLGGTSTSCLECPGRDGIAGSFGPGGAGGRGLAGGGGGGGGYYGGGGGAGTRHDGLLGGGGGGGGGASYLSPTGAALVSMSNDTSPGDGSIVLTPDPSADRGPVVTQISPAADAVFEGTTVPRFTFSATDPDADLRWVGRVDLYDVNHQFLTTLPAPPASSGESVSVSPPGPLPPGTYWWKAVAVDTRGAGGSAGPRRFTVTGPVPGHPLIAAGGFEFHAAASLPAFPCSPPPPFGTGPCGGSFSGAWSGQLQGATGEYPFSVSWAAPAGRFQGQFVYSEWQCAASAELALGIARGTVTAAAEPGEVQGKWQVRGESFPRDVIGVSASFSFDWVRIGTSAALVMQPFELRINVAGLGLQRVVTQAQAGTAALVVTAANGVGGVPSCEDPLTDVDGQIIGTVPLVEASL